MTSTRTARVLAAVAALPLAIVLMGGVAQADSGAIAAGLAKAESNDGDAALIGSGAGLNLGNSTTTQQNANGSGATNNNNNASVIGSGLTPISQHNTNVSFGPLW
ncbi:hypothetical protein AB0F42_01855 [Streptomyces buecherae]|uniref:hypothetical protein n=1 Tax=Streptomyces buecherae TaxID=2763006 RepID=UPI0034018E06